LTPWLLENYRLESAYEKHLIIKVVLVSGRCGQEGRGQVQGDCRVTACLSASCSSSLSTHT
jgi:hypothetical protein